MSSIETKIPNQSVPEAEEVIREHEGAGSFDEIVAMPEPLPGFSIEYPDPDYIPSPKKEELSPTELEETLTDKEKAWVRVIGFAAVAPAITWHGAKQRFNNLVVDWNNLKYGQKRTHSETWMADRKEDIGNLPAWPKNQSPNTRQFVDAAADAKNSGDWMTYQKELLKFADAADRALEDGALSKKVLDQRVDRADKRLSNVEPNRIESQTPPELQREREWLNPKNVLSLKNALTEEMGKNPDMKQHEVARKLLEEYYGASNADLEEGKAVPMSVQEQVADMLDLSKTELEALAGKKNAKVPTGDVRPVYSQKEEYNPYKPTIRMTTPISAQELSQIHAETEEDEELAKAA